MRQLALAIVVFLTGCAALMGKGGQGYFNGSFQTQGAQMQLQESGAQVTGTVTASNLQGTINGTASGHQMQGTVTLQNGQTGNFIMYATVDGMEMRLEGRAPIQFKRLDQAPAAPAPSALGGPTLGHPTAKPDPGATGALARSDAQVPAPSPGGANGAAYRDELDGWEVRTPTAWKHVVKGNTVMFGSDTEAGAIFVSYSRGVSLEQMEQGASTYIASIGATQLGETKSFRTGGKKGIVVEMSGVVEGTAVQARSLGVAGPDGALYVTALTTPEKLPALRKRADQIAMSARFFAPRQSPAMKILAGAWWHYHGTSSGFSSTGGASSSYERTLELCLDGRFYDSSASDIYVSTKSEAWGDSSAGRNSQDGSAGRWTADGNDMQGRLRLVHNNGNIEERAYVFKKRGGGDIELDGRWYGYATDKGGKCR